MTLLTSLGMPSFAERTEDSCTSWNTNQIPLHNPGALEATFVAGMESAHDEEMLQATAPPLLMNDPKPL